MSEDTFLDDTRDPLAESGARAARFAGGGEELETAPAPRGPERGRDLGSVVADRYVLKTYLGSGRYGEIYAAVDRSLSDPRLGLEHDAALHFLHDRISRQTQLLQKLDASYRQTHLWAHPNVVKIQGFGCDRGRYFLVTELLHGRSLRALLDTQSGPRSDSEMFAVLRGVGDALSYAHAKGAVHGDIRPEKIFITNDSAIKVLDLLPATSPRMRPFFIEDAEPDTLSGPDPRDDVYGLACIAYELLGGSHPYNGRSPLEAWNTPLTLEPIARLGTDRWNALARGLALRREQRQASVAAFLAELGVTGRETLVPASRKQTTAPPSASEPIRPMRSYDDDLPVIGDYSGDWDVRTLRTQAPPPTHAQRAVKRAGDAPLRVHPQDARRYAKLAKLRRSRRLGVRFVSFVLVAAAMAAATYLNYEPLRSVSVEWLAKVGPIADALLAGSTPAPPRSEPEAAEVSAPVVVGTPELPAETPDEPAVATGSVTTAASPGGPSAPEGAAPESSPPADFLPEASTPDPPPTEPVAPEPIEPERFEFATSAVSISEAEAGATVPIRRRGGTLGESSIVWWTSDGTAQADSDYADLGPSVEKFAVGEEVLAIYVPIVGDSIAEGRESFYVSLAASEQPSALAEPAPRMEIVVIDDD